MPSSKSKPGHYKRLALAIAFGLAGYAINSLPVTIFPGIHLIFGSIPAIVVAMRYGPAAGGLAGCVAGLRTWSLWHQPLPFSAMLYGLESVWVGIRTRDGKRGPLISTASYWVLLGGWLNLLGQHFLIGFPLRTAAIVQARSVINGMLSGMAVEIALVSIAVFRSWRRHGRGSRPRLSMRALVTLSLSTMITIPMLYALTTSVNQVRDRLVSDVRAASDRSAAAAESETALLIENYQRGLRFAASLFSQARGDSQFRLLGRVRAEFPEFQAMLLGNERGRITAADPEAGPDGKSMIGLEYGEREFFKYLAANKEDFVSHVYQSREGLLGPAVTMGAPVLDEHGELTGFLLGRIDAASFHRVVSRYAEKGEMLIISDGSGQILADSSMDPYSYRQVENAADRPDYVVARSSDHGTGSFTSKTTGPAEVFELKQTSIVSFLTVPVVGWKVWSTRWLGPVQDNLEQFYVKFLIVLALALLAALALSAAIARVLARPLEELQLSAARLAVGDLSQRPAPILLRTSEHDSLVRSFTAMAEQLESSWNRQEELLREASVARRKLEATFDAMTDGVLITDLNDRLLIANRAYCRLRGIDPQQALGSEIALIAHPNRDWHKCEVCMARREGRHAIVLRAANETPIGSDLEIRVDPIYNDAGERVGAVQVLRDLTEKRRAEAEAEKASAMIRDLVEFAYDAVYAADLEGRFVWANRRAAELFGLGRSQIEGEYVLRSVHMTDIERVRKAFELAAAGDAQQHEVQYVSPDGTVRNVLATNSPVLANGRVVAVLGIIRDVTKERLQTQQIILSDKLRALGQLASGVAHNFNNSLAAVLGYTQIAMEKVEDIDVKRHLRTVETAALDAAKMVKRIQDFARQRTDEPTALADLNQVICDALDLTRIRWSSDAMAAGITYDVRFTPAEDVAALCEPSALREVFVNLIINALDAMPRGGLLNITTSATGDRVVIIFRDTGTGMTEEIRRRIFEPFFTTKGVKGYGMGLAVSYGIVERHGGDIAVVSEPARGTTFTISLPRAIEAEAELYEDHVEPKTKPSSVLIVDDEAPIRALLTEMLNARGHNVETAADGATALAALKQRRFDLVITDLAMPSADGWTVVGSIREHNPQTRIVIITGYADSADTDLPDGGTGVVDAVVSKPFNLRSLMHTINQLLATADPAEVRPASESQTPAS